MQYTVEVQGLVKSFGEHRVLDRIDLRVERGTVLALLGANGAGKTTLVRILATLLRPDAGRAVVAGHDVLGDPMAVKRAISLTGQYAAVDDVLTGRENLEMMARLLRLPRRLAASTADDALRAFDLTDAADRRTGTYSGGMRRRLDLAISMMRRPELLFLDEPTTGLDPRSREQVRASVRALVDEGVTVLLTTQYLEEAERLADVITMLDHGRIVAGGSVEELTATVGGEILRLSFVDVQTARAAARLIEAETIDEPACALELRTDGSAEQVRCTLARLEAGGASASKIAISRPSLDDVFFALTDAAGPTRSSAPTR